MKLIIKYYLCIIGISLLFTSCRKQDHFYKDFIKDGEIIYVGKADSVMFHPGKNRVQLSWKMKDPNINKMKVYWNSRQDSLVLDVNKTDHVDSLSVIIEGLEERFYSFEIYSVDAKQNASVKVLAEGQVYGDEFNASLLNRLVNNATFKDNKVTINWFNSSTNMVGSEIKYIDIEGLSKSVFVPEKISQTILTNVDINLPLKYRTLFLPDTLSIDTFYTDFKIITPN